MDVDPFASMRVWELEIVVGSRVITIPALPASEWFPVLAKGDLYAILDMQESNEGEILEDILDGVLSSEDLEDALTDAIEEVCGRAYMVAFTLAYTARTRWDVFGGRLVLAGFRWDEAPIGAALDAIYSILMESLNEEGRTKFLALLENPALLTGGKVRPADKAKMEAGFEEMAGPKPTTGAVRSTAAPSGDARPRTRQRQIRPHPDARSGAPKRQRSRPAESGPAAKT